MNKIHLSSTGDTDNPIPPFMGVIMTVRISKKFKLPTINALLLQPVTKMSAFFQISSGWHNIDIADCLQILYPHLLGLRLTLRAQRH